MQTDEPLVQSALMHLCRVELEAAWQDTNDGISRVGENRGARTFWELRFIRSEVLRLRGQIQQAREYLESLGMPLAGDIESSATLSMHLGYCSALLGNYKSAAALLDESLEQATKANLLRLQFEIKLRRAMCSFLRNDLDFAETTYRELLEVPLETSGWYLHCLSVGGLGKILLHRRRFAEAKVWLEQAIHIAKEADAPLRAAGFESEVALCHLEMGDAPTALKLLRSAELSAKNCGAMHMYQVISGDIGNVYLRQKEYWTAIFYYRRAVKLATEINDPVQIAKWTSNIRLAYAKLVQRH